MKANQIITSGDKAIPVTSATRGEEPARVEIVQNCNSDSAGKVARIRVFFDKGCVA